MDSLIDYYAVLDLERIATSQEIKKAYRKKAKETHSDKLPKNPRPTLAEIEQADAEFKLVAKAYEVLSDPARRAEYDRNFKPPREQHPFEPLVSEAGGSKFEPTFSSKKEGFKPLW